MEISIGFTTGFVAALGALLAYSFVRSIRIFFEYGWHADTTDAPGGKRSGLCVYTDALTGVQYLSASVGGPLTPRLNEDGTLMTTSIEQNNVAVAKQFGANG